MLSRISFNCKNITKYARLRSYHKSCDTPRTNLPVLKLLTPPTKNYFFIPCRRHQNVGSEKPPTNPQRVRFAWKNIFGKYLLVTNVVGSGILMVVGDVMAQEIEFRRGAPNAERYDIARMSRMFVAGALMGPLHHYAYNWMDKIMPVANARNAIRKIIIDQLVMSPACILIFFYTACFLERKSLKETNDELREKFLFIYCVDWLLWPGAQYINFRYLDTKYRVTFVNVCTALYNVFMSYMKHDYDEKIY